MLHTKMQMIFQDPMACLNPRRKVMDIIAEGLDIHHDYKTQEERKEKVYEMLEMVGLSKEHANRYPHQFSGGQRQRIGIARALFGILRYWCWMKPPLRWIMRRKRRLWTPSTVSMAGKPSLL